MDDFIRRKRQNKEPLKEYQTRQEHKSPNFFVSIKITDPEIIQNMAVVQKSISSRHSILDLSHIRLSRTHITLRVAYLETEDEISRMKKSLDQCVQKFNTQFGEPIRIDVNGVGAFGNSVIFASIQRDNGYSMLCKLGEIFEKCCHDNNAPFKKEDGFTPHITIAKMSKMKHLLPELLIIKELFKSTEWKIVKERPKLKLKPRSKPPGEQDNIKTSQNSIFGAAKPVDTASKDRAIEERLLKEKEKGKVWRTVENKLEMKGAITNELIGRNDEEKSSSEGKNEASIEKRITSSGVQQNVKTEIQNKVSPDTEKSERSDSQDVDTAIRIMPCIIRLNVKDDDVINKLYAGIQCPACGRRFPNEEEISRHSADHGHDKEDKRKYRPWKNDFQTFVSPLDVIEKSHSKHHAIHRLWLIWNYKMETGQNRLYHVKIDPASCSQFKNLHFGTQEVGCLQLCEMFTENTGYYPIVHTTTNIGTRMSQD